MKIVICTIPLRSVPTDYPPFGSMALIQSLRLAGYDPYYYDIDGLRPSFDDVIRFLNEYKPDLIGVSAVVSTSYAYTKKLCLALKQSLPGTPIVVGGNLASSAEILHRKAGVDICAVGEGERLIVNLARYFQQSGGKIDHAALRSIKGLTFLDDGGEMLFTGYEEQFPAEQMLDPDFSILEKYSRISNYVTEPMDCRHFARDPRSYQPHRKGQKASIVVSAKGCVARCSFCHRWDKGYRHLPPDAVIRRIKYLKERYNVGFVRFGDENFGSDRRKLEELIHLIRPLDVLYEVGGVRVHSVDRDLIFRLKDSGCSALYFGMESGSQRMLQVMEKSTTVAENINAAFWTHEAGLYTIYQIVLGMPGETSETVGETLEFLKKVTGILPEPPHKRLSTNYLQSLPGTPVYEWARRRGLIGRTIEDEERYLLGISNVDAAEDRHYVNCTEEDYFTARAWRAKLMFETEANWYRIRGWNPEEYILPGGLPSGGIDYFTPEGGYFNIFDVRSINKMFHQRFFYRYFYFARHFYYAAYVLAKGFKTLSFPDFLGKLFEWAVVRFHKRQGLRDYRSLRILLKEMPAAPRTQTETSMQPLREGR